MNEKKNYRSLFGERRKNKRFRLKDGYYVVRVSNSEKIMGAILDISEEGLAFRYKLENLVVNENFKLDILKKNDTICLQNVRYQNMNDFEMGNNFNCINEMKRRRGVKFVNLNSKQKFSIATLIKNCNSYPFPY